jgi:hypothetical protein
MSRTSTIRHPVDTGWRRFKRNSRTHKPQIIGQKVLDSEILYAIETGNWDSILLSADRKIGFYRKPKKKASKKSDYMPTPKQPRRGDYLGFNPDGLRRLGEE